MKRKYTNGILFLLMALLLVPMLTACSSYDEDYAIYELWVAGVKVTTRNQADILGNGTVSYIGDSKSGTLTLNGANITQCSDTEAEAFIVSTIDNLTINLIGENKIGMGEKAPVNGVSAYDLIIQGEGSLSVGARASCIKANMLTVESGKIDTYINTAEDEIASFIGVGLWAQEFLQINGGEVGVHYLAEFSPLSYGLYCVKDIAVNGGSIHISAEDSQFLGVGLISSEKLTVAGGEISTYGFDDAINAKTFAMTGGTVNANAVDIFVDGVCRLVNKAEFSGGEMTMTCLMKMNPTSKTLLSKDLVLTGMTVKGGDTSETLTEQDTSTYEYADTCIRIEKEVN